jgi:hypothetical protein
MPEEWYWEEALPEPHLSLRARFTAFLRKLRPTRSGALSCAKSIVKKVRGAPSALRSRMPRPADLAEVRNLRDLRNALWRKKNQTYSFEREFGDDSDALPPSVVTHLKWKEGKLSDGGRWWGPLRPNRKQKYTEIQKIIGETFTTDNFPPSTLDAATALENRKNPAAQTLDAQEIQLNSPPSDAPCLVQETASRKSR